MLQYDPDLKCNNLYNSVTNIFQLRWVEIVIFNAH
jgi:hypothetical protein